MLNLTNLSLDLSDNRICDEGVAKLCESVSKLQKLTILNLDFKSNGIGAYIAA